MNSKTIASLREVHSNLFTTLDNDEFGSEDRITSATTKVFEDVITTLETHSHEMNERASTLLKELQVQRDAGDLCGGWHWHVGYIIDELEKGMQ